MKRILGVCGLLLGVAAGAGGQMQAASDPLAPLPVDPAVKSALAGISADQVRADVEKLGSFGTRNTLSSMDTELPPGQGINAAAAWIESEFQGISAQCGGCLEVKRDEFVEPAATGPLSGTTGVNSTTTATITAGSGSGSQTATLTIAPALLSSLSLSPTSVGGGVTSTGTVTLSGPAGPGGTSVAITSSSASAVVASTALVPAGQTSGTFTITTTAVSASTTATITASLHGTSKTASLTITPPTLAAVSVPAPAA